MSSFIQFVQGNTVFAAANTNPENLAFSSINTAGNCIVLFVDHSSSRTETTITDTGGNTYNQVYKNVTGGPLSRLISLYYALNITGGTNTISIGMSSTGVGFTAVAQEFSGVMGASALDTNNHTTISSYANPQNGAAVTNTNTNAILVSAYSRATNTTFTLGTGFSNLTTNSATASIAMQSQLLSTTGTWTPTIGTGATGFAGDSVSLVLFANNKSFITNNLRPHAFSPGLSR